MSVKCVTVTRLSSQNVGGQNRFASSKTSFQQQQPEKRSPPPPPEKRMRPDEVAMAIKNGEMVRALQPRGNFRLGDVT